MTSIVINSVMINHVKRSMLKIMLGEIRNWGSRDWKRRSQKGASYKEFCGYLLYYPFIWQQGNEQMSILFYETAELSFIKAEITLKEPVCLFFRNSVYT